MLNRRTMLTRTLGVVSVVLSVAPEAQASAPEAMKTEDNGGFARRSHRAHLWYDPPPLKGKEIIAVPWEGGAKRLAPGDEWTFVVHLEREVAFTLEQINRGIDAFMDMELCDSSGLPLDPSSHFHHYICGKRLKEILAAAEIPGKPFECYASISSSIVETILLELSFTEGSAPRNKLDKAPWKSVELDLHRPLYSDRRGFYWTAGKTTEPC